MYTADLSTTQETAINNFTDSTTIMAIHSEPEIGTGALTKLKRNTRLAMQVANKIERVKIRISNAHDSEKILAIQLQ